jgi:hypothetical protein
LERKIEALEYYCSKELKAEITKEFNTKFDDSKVFI